MSTTRKFPELPRFVPVVLLLAAMLAVTGRAATFEQDHRLTNLVLQTGTSAFATNNAFGSAFVGGLVRQGLQDALDGNIADGSLTILLTMPSLSDLRGTNDPSFSIGFVNGTPVIPASSNTAPYSGTSDLDWWYRPNPSDLDAAGIALHQMPASFAAGVLDAGPADITLASLVDASSGMRMFGVRLRANTGGSTAPLQSTNGFPPGYLPEDNIPASLQSFATLTSGQLHGGISALSLANAPIPDQLVGGNQGYTTNNSWLDVMVGGWSQFIIGTQIAARQPDIVDPSVPAAGAGGPYTFVTDSSTKRVIGCRDRMNSAVDLAAGLNAAGYSAYFTFGSDRVIVLSGAVPVAPLIAPVQLLPGGVFHFRFTNYARASFTVLAATNVDLPLTNWSAIGSATQSTAGVFEFSDQVGTNGTRKFYKVRAR